MYHEDYVRTLCLACDIHSEFRTQIDLKNQDRKLAIYYLQGGSLTAAHVALKNWECGDLNGVWRAQKFIAETNGVLQFLSIEENVDRELRNFFNGGYIELPNLDSKKKAGLKEKVLKIRGHDEETHKKFTEATKQLTEEFSKGGHPTLYSSAYNSDKETGEFDYELKDDEFKHYPIRNFDFANFIIIPAANSVYVYSQAFSVEKEYLDKLGDAINHIQEQAINFQTIRKSMN